MTAVAERRTTRAKLSRAIMRLSRRIVAVVFNKWNAAVAVRRRFVATLARTVTRLSRRMAGPDTSTLSQLNLSDCVSVTTQLIPLIHSEVLKLS